MRSYEEQSTAARRWQLTVALAMGWWAFSACGGGGSTSNSCTDGAADACATPSPVAEAGYVSLDRAAYSLGNQQLQASASRFFYDFQPASADVEQPPLLVVTGGGPAAACAFLFAFCSGRNRVQERSDSELSVAANPTPFTDFAHVLHIDARNSGFSYAVLDDPNSEADRSFQFAVDDYNAYRDAADVLRVLSAFLQSHPGLLDGDLYFVSESYGGVRTAIMLNLLLFAEEYAAGARTFQDSGLSAAVEQLRQARFGGDRDEVTPALWATFVRGQILMQPQFGGTRQTAVAAELLEQPGSVLYELAAAAGATYVPCAEQSESCDPYTNALGFVESLGRSPYDTRNTPDWLDWHLDQVAEAATHRAALALLLDLDLTKLDEVFATPRPGAYRFSDPRFASMVTRGDLETHYGTLAPWDAHFVDLNREALNAFVSRATQAVGGDPAQTSYAELFLQDLRYTEAFVTHAAHDLIVYSPAIAPTLSSYEEVLTVGEVADEQLEVRYVDGDVGRLTIPRYPDSGHSVCRDQPAKLHNDIREFIAQDRR